MPTFERGFKVWAERTSISLRRELGIKSCDPLIPHELALFLKVDMKTPNDIQGLSQSHKRQLLNIDPKGWSAVTVETPEKHVIIYNPHHSIARQSSDQMHELAHILIKHEPSQLILCPNGDWVMRSYDQKQEDEAAWFSGCLLLPREALLEILKNGGSDEEACRHYGVSKRMLMARRNLSGVNIQMRRNKNKKKR